MPLFAPYDNASFASNGFNTLTPRQNGRYFADIFKYIYLNENFWISNENSLKNVPYDLIDNRVTLLQKWHGTEQVTSHYLKQS